MRQTENAVHPPSVSTTPTALRVCNLSKSFPGTVALDDVSLDVRPGEIHALVGQNGSGKSTLIKILAGYHAADPGSRAFLADEEFSVEDTTDTRHSRIRFVHQDLGLFLELNVMDNLALRGSFLTSPAGSIRWKEQARRTRELLDEFGADLDIRAPLGNATPVQRTIVAIAAALAGWDGGSGVLVLDEPTAVLPHHEVERLLEIVHTVRSRGAGVLYVSHRLDEIFEVADRVTVLRDGKVVATRGLEGLTTQGLAELMVGSTVDASYRTGVHPAADAEVALAARGLAAQFLDGVDFEVKRGEILGLAGLPGSGAEELPSLLAGALKDLPIEGEICLPRRGTAWHPASKARSLGLPLAPADRVRDGIVGEFSVAENMSLSVLSQVSTAGRVSGRRERALVSDWSERVEVKTASPDSPITSLSGGNQQKVVMARCLTRSDDVLLLSEPTAGVDVGTRQVLYELIAAEAAKGLAVIVSSTDSGDLLALCSRVLVFSRGKVVRQLERDEIDEQSLLHAIEESVALSDLPQEDPR